MRPVRRVMAGEPVAAVARELACSEPWVRKWLRRYDPADPDWARERSRAPQVVAELPDRVWVVPHRLYEAAAAPGARAAARSLLHLVAFLAGGALLPSRRAFRRRPGSVVLATGGLAVPLQVGKIFVAGRHPAVLAVFSQVLGALLGALLAERRRPRYRPVVVSSTIPRLLGGKVASEAGPGGSTAEATWIAHKRTSPRHSTPAARLPGNGTTATR